eukprot:4584818-Prymnesium_polylepis.1
MTDPRSLPRLLRLTPAPDASTVFVAEAGDWWVVSARAFGGQLAGHCTVAAACVAPAGWECHSLHLHFLQAGRMVRTRYEVHTMRLGRTFATFEVSAYEDDERRSSESGQPGSESASSSESAIVRAVVSFHDSSREQSPPLHVSPAPTMAPPGTLAEQVPSSHLRTPFRILRRRATARLTRSTMSAACRRHTSTTATPATPCA